MGGRYVLERELGRGGMATVWLARDLRYDRPVALKVLHPDLAHSLGPERFLREIKLAARLQHPHVVSVYDSGAAGSPEGGGAEHLWYTMPYVEGESLRERLRRERPFPLQDALSITRSVAHALQYAHGQGVIHRDIKPENVLLTRDGNALVADFGIARPLQGDAPQHLTTSGVVVGTPSYMSPEQASGSEIDGRTDIYSLGCVLYEMLVGEPPFTGPTIHAVVAQHLTKPAPPVGAAAEVPESVSRAVAKALAKAPAERFASAAEFAAALEVTAGAPEQRSGRFRGAAAAAAILAGLAATYWTASRISAPGSAAASEGGTVASGFNRKLAQLTFGEGPEEWPAWSPDGKLLAYVSEVSGFRQLIIRTLATGEEKRLSEGPRDHVQPTWSPDGSRLAFVRAMTATGKLEPDDILGHYFEGGEIWTIEVGSLKQTKLIEGGFNPSYSPNGERLSFDALWAGPRRIWVADASGRNPRQVSSDSSEAVVHTQARWSPDGSKLVFRRIEKTKSDLAVSDLGSQSVAKVTDDYAIDLDPVWSPDGRWLYFSSSRGGGLNIWRVPVSVRGEPDGPLEQVTTGAGDDVQPAIAPDGRRVLFEVRGNNSDLWTLPIAPQTGRPTGEPQPLLATTRVESRGTWSPDGQTIAFNSDRLGEMNIWLRQQADGSERQVTTGSGGDYQPTWAPDGSTVVFFSARTGNTDIWSVRVADGKLTRLTEHRALDTNPFYSPDGRWIAFVSDRSGRSEVWLMSADGSGQRQLASVGVWGHFLLWTNDSREVVFKAEGGPPFHIFRVSIESGALTPLPEVGSGAHMSFSPDRSVILDVRGHKVLWAHPMNGAAPYQVFEFANPDVRIDYPVWSPDGKSVLFDRAAPRGGDLWMLEGVM